MCVDFQREALEEQFDELFKDASEDVIQQMRADLDGTDGCDTGSGGDTEDDLVLEEYVSEDENEKGGQGRIHGEEEEEDDDDHVTKVKWDNCSIQ